MAYGDFRTIADNEGFILVHPEGELFNGQTHWNVGGWTLGSTVDDVGFTEKMIGDISANYNINHERIYSTGMSNGGFMSFLLSCQLSNKIAAIASVTGSMTPSTFTNCDPQHPIPVLYIHGTSDNVVPYTGATWTKKVEEVIEYWKVKNECDADATLETLTDSNTSDGSTAEIISYLKGDSGSEVVHYKIIGGDHTWPGTTFDSPGTNQDFNASEVIWNFLSKYDINGLRDIETSIDQTQIQDQEISIFPNPTSSIINITFKQLPSSDYELKNLAGEIILRGKFTQKEENFNISKFPNGNYILSMGNRDFKVTKVE